ncbi:GNAT family N-acetyltransferase [Erythrobacter sp. HKB08]|uniref:GNAT family N-acetyltransferase n=1 Tax=Erythrobacter sp. HKB08 TaxID=2502843 RepID=UPI0010090FA9|nr:GNAT family N-acetyltransferase [Erythrobacter sp. HKB08]
MIIETHLNDGSPVCIRSVRKEDEERLREGIAKLSPQSRYLRFFSGMPQPPQTVLDRLLDVDGHDHIAWGAIRTDLDEAPAIGVVHAFRDREDASVADFSVAVIDEYHKRGLARLLTAVLLLDCRDEDYDRLSVHILPENKPALTLAKSLGAEHVGYESGVSQFEIDIENALATLKQETDVPGLAEVFEQFGG